MSCGGGGNNKVKETPEQKQAAKVAIERYRLSQNIEKPVEDWLIQRVGSIGSDKPYAEGVATADRAQAFAPAEAKMIEAQRTAGVNPSSGRFTVGTLGHAARAEAGSRTSGVAGADIGNENRRIAGKEAVLGVGLGKASSADLGFQTEADRSARIATADARTAAYNRNAERYALGQLAGAGAYAYGSASPGLDAMKRRTMGYSAPSDGLRGW